MFQEHTLVIYITLNLLVSILWSRIWSILVTIPCKLKKNLSLFYWEYLLISNKSKENRISPCNFEHLKENITINKPNQCTVLWKVTMPIEVWGVSKTTLKRKKEKRKENPIFKEHLQNNSLFPIYLFLYQCYFYCLFSYYGLEYKVNGIILIII